MTTKGAVLRNKSWFILLALLLLPVPGYAIFCPTNFNQINIGDTQEQVIAQCGKPAKEESREVQSEGPQEWSYYIPQTVATTTMAPSQGTLKTQLTFDGAGKTINISVNGIGVGSTTICGSTIQLGDSREAVKAACGEPSFINKQNSDSSTGQANKKITTLIYNSDPPASLTFENGILTSAG